jgi:two-component system, sensor histidine kinase and response regulator
MRTNSDVFRSFLREAQRNTERSRYWETIVQSLHDGVVALDKKNIVVEWNKGARKLFGFSRREAIGNNLDRLIGGAKVREAVGITNAVLKGRSRVVEMDSVRFRKDGKPVEVGISASSILMNGRIEGGVAVYQDISERRKKEREIARVQEDLGALKEFNENIVRSLAEGIVLEDARGRIVFVNPSMERLLGFKAEELIGRHQKIFVSPKELEKIRAKTRSRAVTTLETYETRFRAKGGREIPVLVSAQTLFERGKFKGVLSAVTNISEQKRTEAELKASRIEAQAANAAKSEFLANMSHEIRTPMNGIIGMTELALDTELTPVQRDYLDSIKSSADSLLTLLNDILDFSKIEARMVDFEPIRFRLRDSVGDAVSFLALDAHKKGLEVACRIAPEVPEALIGDVRRLRQVLINLVSNAIKFTERGEVFIDVKLESRDRAHAVLHFTVTDTGIGIPKEKQPAIFQAFVQADGSTTRKYGGTGLGLAISTRLVEMMGGKIWVDSKPGRGSRFHFTARLAIQRTALRATAPARPSEIQGLPVLVVDDNATNRKILKEILISWRMHPLTVSHGAAAVAALRRQKRLGKPVGLALIDANMPGMDGFELIKRIRTDPNLRSIKVMILTSSDRSGDIARCRSLGVQAYLTKPVRQSELLDAILIARASRSTPGAFPQFVTKSSPSNPTKPLRILLAEDNPVNRKLAVHLLERRGHSVQTVDNGQGVLDALGRERFDLVLMDVQMPVIDGFETTAMIRKQEKGSGRHLPIVALTAHALREDRDKCLASGMDEYVSKPLNPEELFRAIAKAAGKTPEGST